MKCAIYVLYNTEDIKNIEDNYKILSKTIDSHFLISFIEEFNFSFKFTQIFCKPTSFRDDTDRVLNFFKILSNIFKYLNIKRYRNAIIVSGSLKLNPYKTNALSGLLDSIQDIEDVDLVIFNKSGKLTNDLILCRVWFLLMNLEYYNCGVEEFRKKTENKNPPFYLELFLNSPYMHSRNLEDYT